MNVQKRARPAEVEFLPEILQVVEKTRTPASRSILWVVIVLILSGIAAACIIETDVVVQGTGRIISDGNVRSLQAEETSIVKDILVREGDLVRTGQALIELEPALKLADVAAVEARWKDSSVYEKVLRGVIDRKKVDVSQFSKEDAPLITARMTEIRSMELAHIAKLSEAQADLAAKRRQLEVEEESLLRFNTALEGAREREESARPHIGDLISRFDYLKLKEAVEGQKSEEKSQKYRISAAREAVSAASKRIDAMSEERTQRLQALLQEKLLALATLAPELEKARYQASRKTLRSPMNGIIQTVNVNTPGGVVGPSVTVVSIVPNNMKLLVEGYINSEDSRGVTKGLPVNISIRSYPSNKFGILTGIISNLSADAFTPNENTDRNRAPITASMQYRIAISLDSTRFTKKNNEPVILKPGQEADISIRVGHRRIIDIALEPILKASKQAATVR